MFIVLKRKAHTITKPHSQASINRVNYGVLFSSTEGNQTVLTTSNLTIQFGPKPLFENVSVKFGEGNRYGLIGANGSGKSTFMKILGGELEATRGTVSFDPDEKMAMLSQDQFAYEDFSVLDTVIMGDKTLWTIKQERDAIYNKPEMTERKAK